MYITEDIKYIGVNDHDVDLFEGQYIVPNGMAYNSYVIIDEKIAVMDTVDSRFSHEWLDNIKEAIGSRKPDYLVVQHMEPDHSANIAKFLEVYPDAQIVGNTKTFTMIDNFFGKPKYDKHIVNEGDTLSLGKHNLTFVFGPMVHWPEVMLTYDSTDKALFSADAFGKFGALDREEEWDCEARRYYFGIVGKYGAQVQSLLKKASGIDIDIILSLHGPVLKESLSHYLSLYDIWSSYGVESEGIVIAYTSVYGNTKKAVEVLTEKLYKNGCPRVVVHDLARTDMAEAVEDAFRYGKLVLATTTYNGDVFPFMREFINHLKERNYQNRTIALIENGSWAPTAAKVMRESLSTLKNITFTDTTVKIMSALDKESSLQVEELSKELCQDYSPASLDMNALFKIGYGLYVVTSNDGAKDNGIIVNTISQVTDAPKRVSVTINKNSYSCHTIKRTGIMNVNCLNTDAPFETFKNFGFQSGRTVDKFKGIEVLRSQNGLRVLPEFINAVMSLKVIDTVDLGTHTMFICDIEEAKIINNKETMTYTYYQENVKQNQKVNTKKGYVCKICGFVYTGDVLPDGYICPLCKHDASFFEPIGEED